MRKTDNVCVYAARGVWTDLDHVTCLQRCSVSKTIQEESWRAQNVCVSTHCVRCVNFSCNYLIEESWLKSYAGPMERWQGRRLEPQATAGSSQHFCRASRMRRGWKDQHVLRHEVHSYLYLWSKKGTERSSDWETDVTLWDPTLVICLLYPADRYRIAASYSPYLPECTKQVLLA